MGTITFSAKRSDPPMQWGTQYIVCVRSFYPHRVDAVGMQYTVGVSAKKSLYPHAVDVVDAVGVGAKMSTDTVYSANKDGGGHYL